MIYRYFNGERMVSADPMRLWLDLQEHPEYNAEVHASLVDQGDVEATQVATKAVRDVFGVRSFDPHGRKGLTLGEQISLLTDFYLYLEEQKKTLESTLISPPNTEASTSTGSASETTPSMSDSGAT